MEETGSQKPETRSQKWSASSFRLLASGFRLLSALGFWLLAPFLTSGCITGTPNYSVKPATAIDPATRRMNYWFDKPANDSVAASDYDALWNAANQAAIDHSFTADLIDYREGRLTTRPLISKQPLELWKHDVIDPKSQLDCMLSTMRRTVEFRITRREDGTFVCEPKAVAERYVMPERRITSVVEYQEAFSTRRPAINGASDEGDALPIEYWYAVGRDPALEHAIANAMRRVLKQQS